MEHLWEAPTLIRRVTGKSVEVAVPVYVAFVDSPEVVAPAARHLGLAHWYVQELPDGVYQGEDHEGAVGYSQIVEREPGRRVILSWGEHSGHLLGTIHGSTLSVLDFQPRQPGVHQSLTAYIRIDNRAAAALARALVPIFGWLADRKLAQGLNVTAAVAEWATGRPDEFCAWLEQTPVPGEAQQRVAAVLPACRLHAARPLS